MVRVLSVYHFGDQHQDNHNYHQDKGHPIRIGDEVNDTCLVGDTKLAVATPNLDVEIWDLSTNSQCYIFPTVDEVAQLCYCQNGNYFATIETKTDSRHRLLSFVRIYTNWDSIEQNPEMMINFRARIAGKVTPSDKYLSSNDLEMIELPMKQQQHPTRLACCQVSFGTINPLNLFLTSSFPSSHQITGNIALCCDNKVLFFEFRAVATENNRHEYIDLLEIPFHVELSFAPASLLFCEGVISCWDDTSLNIFKIQRAGDSQSISVSFSSASMAADKSQHNSFTPGWTNTKDPIDFRQVAEQKMLNQSVFRVEMMSDADDFGQCDLKPEALNDMLIMLRANGNGDCELMTKYTIKSLLQLKSRRRRGFSDSFKSVFMRPLYKFHSTGNDGSIGENIFQSAHSRALASVSVAVATQHDAYLYHFSGSAVEEWRHHVGTEGCNTSSSGLVASYSFTSPVIDVAIDSAVLHALTETGIETYTLRTGQRIFYESQNGDEEIIRAVSAEESICLIGIQPVILSAKRIFCSETNVVVLISGNDRAGSNVEMEDADGDGHMDDGQFLVKSYRKPEMEVVYRNIEEFATRFRFDNPRLFVHLMNEAHVMVRLSVEMSHSIPVDELNRQNLRSIPLITFSANPDVKLIDIFTESCCTLADYFVAQPTEDDYYMALPYYLMGQLGVNEIFNRLIQFETNQNIVSPIRIYPIRVQIKSFPLSEHVRSRLHPEATLPALTTRGGDHFDDHAFNDNVQQEYGKQSSNIIKDGRDQLQTGKGQHHSHPIRSPDQTQYSGCSSDRPAIATLRQSFGGEDLRISREEVRADERGDNLFGPSIDPQKLSRSCPPANRGIRRTHIDPLSHPALADPLRDVHKPSERQFHCRIF